MSSQSELGKFSYLNCGYVLKAIKEYLFDIRIASDCFRDMDNRNSVQKINHDGGDRYQL